MAASENVQFQWLCWVLLKDKRETNECNCMCSKPVDDKTFS